MAKATAADKEKRVPKFLRKIFESPKNKAARLSTKSGKANVDATKKMYAAESMFKSAKKAENAIAASKKDTAKTKISDRSFKSTFDAASKAGKSTFTYGGRSFMTNKGKDENKDKMKTRIAPKGSIKKPAKKLDADTVKSYKKRIKYMKDRKAKGKNYSAKNLKELEAKLAANQ